MAEVNINELKNKFQRGAASENKQAIIDLFKLAGIEDNYAEAFVAANYRFIGMELNAYGFSQNNCFIKFLLEIQKQKKEILDIFLDSNNWSIIHNVVANDILTPDQIMFTSDELDQPKLLINPSFWKDIENIDKLWVLQLWEWCNTSAPNTEIVNDAVRAYLQGKEINIDNLWDKYSNEEPRVSFSDYVLNSISSGNLSDKDVVENLRRALIYTSDIIEASKTFKFIMDQINKDPRKFIEDKSLQQKYNNLVSRLPQISFVSSRLVSADTMSASVRACSEEVQKSDRNAFTGRYQEQEGEQNTKKSNFTSTQKGSRLNSIKSEAQAIDTLNQNGIDISKIPFNTRTARNAQQIGDSIIYLLQNGYFRR